MIVWLASYPRSGNRFARTLLVRELASERIGNIYPSEDERGLASPLEEVNYGDEPQRLDNARRSVEGVFVKTHALADPSDDSPAIYLVRDGRDAVVSYARFAISQRAEGFEGRSLEEAAEAIIRQDDPKMGGWSTNVRSWTRRGAPTAIVRFEEFIQDPLRILWDAVSSVGISLNDPVNRAPTFEQLHRDSPVLYPRGKVGAWKSEMSDRLERLFWEAHGAEMLVMGYPRERIEASGSLV